MTMERIARFYHGTTVVRAQRIATAAEFAAQKTFLALGDSNRDLAEIFARRTAQKHPNEGGPALVIVTMAEAAFESLRQQQLIRLIGFDAEDRPELRMRSQWVLEMGGVQRFNQESDDWEWQRLT
jgi:hypothetical protein